MAKDKEDLREEEDGIKYYTVERGVPIPQNDIVPIQELEVGESIAFPEYKRNAVASTASRLKKAGESEFIVRKIGTSECRIWRIN